MGVGGEKGNRGDAGEVHEVGNWTGLSDAGVHDKRRRKEGEIEAESGEKSMAV